MPPIIQIKGVFKSFAKTEVLKNINLDIYSGEIIGVMGLSGSGKTTLFKTIVGFYEPDEGQVLYYSDISKTYKSIHKNMIEISKIFGFSTQDPSFYLDLTVAENLDYFGSLYNLSKKTRQINTEHLLELTELSDFKNQLSKDLSGGMQKRLSIACSLIHKPKILILDEPTADLDPILRRETWQLIKGINKLGTTIIIASHFITELEQYCTRIALLHNSTIIKVGTPDELKASTREEIVILRSSPGNYEEIAKEIGKYSSLNIKDMTIKDSHLYITAHYGEKTLDALLAVCKRLDEKIIDVQMSKPSLKDLFESIAVKEV
jgi:ABC-2 type transport system ATP-binding protein